MKIAVTKLEEKSEGIPELFRQYGHEAVIVSTMRAAPPADPAPLSKLCQMISENKIDILIFTSALGVDIFFKKLKQICVHLCSSAVYKSILKNVRIVSVGPKTAKKVEEYGMRSEIIDKFSSDNFAQYLGDISGKTIGIARADVPNLELVNSLTAKGATVIEAPAYRLAAGDSIVEVLDDVDAVIFTSAKSFELSGFAPEHAKKLKVIAIGQKTAEAMRKYRVIPDFVGNGTLEACLSQL
ncbi:MAG: uroporphyrinogen-III synthase [Candidatus Methanoperedens sp.]|nr:uroporphyrinogen-III synthase [Candidatus Methanoperedens sp.]